MVADCVDVCNAVMVKLIDAGFKINTEDPDHQDMLYALDECELVKK